MENKETLNIKDLCQSMNVPVVAGNCVTYEVAKLLMDAGVAGLTVGIGPGAACTQEEYWELESLKQLQLLIVVRQEMITLKRVVVIFPLLVMEEL